MTIRQDPPSETIPTNIDDEERISNQNDEELTRYFPGSFYMTLEGQICINHQDDNSFVESSSNPDANEIYYTLYRNRAAYYNMMRETVRIAYKEGTDCPSEKYWKNDFAPWGYRVGVPFNLRLNNDEFFLYWNAYYTKEGEIQDIKLRLGDLGEVSLCNPDHGKFWYLNSNYGTEEDYSLAKEVLEENLNLYFKYIRLALRPYHTGNANFYASGELV